MELFVWLAYVAVFTPAAVPVLVFVALVQRWQIHELDARVQQLESELNPEPADAGTSKGA